MKFQSLLFTMLVAVLSFGQVPTITSFSPTSGPVGTTVTITGTNFSTTAANNTVFVGSAKATVTSASSTSLTITVPTAASSNGTLQVVVSQKTALAKMPFIFTYSGGVEHSQLPSNQFNTSTSSANVGPDLTGDGTAYQYAGTKMTSGDFDNDGDMDFVALGVSTGQTMKIYKNTSTTGQTLASSFFTTTDFSFSSLGLVNSLNIHPVDINADGKLDVVAGGDNNLVILINNSNSSAISFTENIVYTESWVGHSRFKMSDLDGDGSLDIITVGAGNVVHLFRNTSNSTLTFSHSTLGTTTNFAAMDVDLADLNNDGKKDIVLYSYNYNVFPNTPGKITKYINSSTSGSFTFGNSEDLYTGFTIGGYSLWGGITVADVDKNGFDDIFYTITGGSSAGYIQQLFGISQSSSGVFTTAFSIGNYTANSHMPNMLSTCDVNGDGKTDIVGWGTNGAGVYVVLNKYSSGTLGTSSFGTKDNIQFGGDIMGFAFNDFNKDGKIDIIHQNYYNGNLNFYPNIPPVAPTITAQPALTNSSICTMVSSGSMSITASGASSYQWQISSNSGSTWADISGATSATYTGMVMNTPGTFLFRCVAISSLGAGTNSNSVTLTVNGSTFTTQPTTTAINICHNATPQSLSIATNAPSPSYVWQQSTNGSTGWVDATTATGYQTTTMTPSHSEINWGVRYYRCVVTSGSCSTPSDVSAAYSIVNLTQSAHPSTFARNYCLNGTSISLSVTASAMGSPITYIWQSATTANGSYSNVVGGSGASTSSYTPPTNTVGTLYYRCYYQFCGGYSQASNPSGAITVSDTYTWTGGANTTNPLTAANWSPAVTPCANTNRIIPSGLTYYPSYSNLTISAGTTLTIQSGAKLDITGTLTNNGTLTIESGATLVQGASSTLAGTGTYNVQQAITGAGSTTPSGRFWYLGSPVTTASSSVYFANAANVVKKRDEVNNAWTAISSGTPENLVVGKGYYTQAMANSTITFTGGAVNNGAITINGLTRTAGQNFEGFNLVSNPYPSYLNWDAVTKTNVDGTIWYRTHDGSNMVFDTYVANAAGGIGTNLSGNTATKYIPPMQSFWVRVSQGQTSGSLTLGNAMRSHFASLGSSTAGLRSTNDELKLFLRMNLLQADKKDQIIVYVNGNATNGFDALDGEKMMQAGIPQFYTKAADKKITINGLNSAKKQQSLPITMELPTTGVHSFVIEDLEIDNGLVWLEDKQEEIMQALEPGTVYEFYANSGINAERFVLHFQLIDDATPVNVYNEVNSSANFSGKGASVHAEAAGVVVIKLPTITEGVTDIQIRDAAGRLVYTGSTNTLETSIQLEQANGIYYVTLNGTSGVEVRKVFVQQ